MILCTVHCSNDLLVEPSYYQSSSAASRSFSPVLKRSVDRLPSSFFFLSVSKRCISLLRRICLTLPQRYQKEKKKFQESVDDRYIRFRGLMLRYNIEWWIKSCYPIHLLERLYATDNRVLLNEVENYFFPIFSISLSLKIIFYIYCNVFKGLFFKS